MRRAKAATRRPPAQDRKPWNWFFSGLLCGAFSSLLIYLAIPRPEGNALPDLSLAAGQETPPANAEVGNPVFEFYESLRDAEIKVDVVPVPIRADALDGPASHEGAASANPVRYLLQAGSFQIKNDADALRASLLLLNMEAAVVPAVLAGRTWYRVQAGPFVGRASVEAAEDALIANDIDPIRLTISMP